MPGIPKVKTAGTRHHCPGDKAPINGIAAGGCRWLTVYHPCGLGVLICVVHQELCPAGCEAYCLKGEKHRTCCEDKAEGIAARERRAAKAQAKKDAKNYVDPFFNPGKGRKKPGF